MFETLKVSYCVIYRFLQFFVIIFLVESSTYILELNRH